MAYPNFRSPYFVSTGSIFLLQFSSGDFEGKHSKCDLRWAIMLVCSSTTDINPVVIHSIYYSISISLMHVPFLLMILSFDSQMCMLQYILLVSWALVESFHLSDKYKTLTWNQ